MVFELGVPVLGICYGMQTMAAQLGGEVEELRRCASSAMPKFGREARRRCCEGIQDRIDDEGRQVLDVWMSHGDKVTAMPPGFKAIGEQCRRRRLPAIADEARRFYGIQFHPEVTHTPQGKAIICSDSCMRSAMRA